MINRDHAETQAFLDLGNPLGVAQRRIKELEKIVVEFVVADEERKIIGESKARADAMTDFRERLKGYGIGLDE